MLVESRNIVTSDDLRRDLSKYIQVACSGRGPVAISHKAKIVGFLIGPDEYEALFSTEVKNLLDSRSGGPTVSQKEARARIKQALQRRPRKA